VQQRRLRALTRFIPRELEDSRESAPGWICPRLDEGHPLGGTVVRQGDEDRTDDVGVAYLLGGVGPSRILWRSYPTDLQDAAVQTVLRQAEALAASWVI
jgi:hypothetical protein